MGYHSNGSELAEDGAKAISKNDMPSHFKGSIANKGSENTIITLRGDVVENTHRIHAAVTSSTGHLLYSLGDASRVVLARSAAKPIQSLAILQTGAAAQFNLSDADIALMSASHNSEPRHILRAQDMLRRTGAKEEDLACGGHPSISPTVNRGWIKQDFSPTAICNNCSGKHAGMIAGAVALGAPVKGYHGPGHPMQQAVKLAVEQTSGLTGEEVLWAVDGCNLPAPALPLKNMATMYAKLADACDGGDEKKGTEEQIRREMLARIHRSMAAYPEMVGGEGRFCTELMDAYQGLLVGKVGADGCYGVAIRARQAGAPNKGEKGRPLGIAVKVEDGNLDILYSAIVEILEILDVGSREMRQKLEAFHHPPIVNTAGVVTGGYRHGFKFRERECQ